jgi:dephospho-CoA kinase
MLRIGLTGGIGAGKSAVASALAARGAVVVDADRLAREVVEPGTPGLAAIVEAFGADVLQSDGALDRARLGARVFNDPEALRRLGSITHPLIGAATAERIAAAPADAVLVQDIPLLVEAGMAASFHLVVVVTAPREVRLDRLVSARGMDRADAEARMATQASDEQRAAVADVLIDNSGDRAALDATVDALWIRRLHPYSEALHRGLSEAPHGSASDGAGALRAEEAAAPVQAGAETGVETEQTTDARGARVVARLENALGERVTDVQTSGSAGGVLTIEATIRSPSEAGEVARALAESGWFPDRSGEVYLSVDPGDPAQLIVTDRTHCTRNAAP